MIFVDEHKIKGYLIKNLIVLVSQSLRVLMSVSDHKSFGIVLVHRLNILAELLCFGDREFYKDWWNAKSVGDVSFH